MDRQSTTEYSTHQQDDSFQNKFWIYTHIEELQA